MQHAGVGLDVLFAVAIWIALVGIALSYYQVAIQKARQTGLWQWTVSARQEIMLFHAARGRWPASEDLLGASDVLDNYAQYGLQSVQIRDGSFNLVLSKDRGALGVGDANDQWNLSFRRQRYVPGAPISWTCGPATASFEIDAPPDLTDLDPRLLPSVCRH